MRLIDGSDGIRFGLYVFVFLVVFCLAQLTWWIIYQLDLNRQIYQNRMDLLTAKKEAIADRVNGDFGRTADLAAYTLRSANGDFAVLAKCVNGLLSNRAIVGFQIADNSEVGFRNGGRIDSTFYYHPGPGMTLYFDPDYPGSLTGGDPPDLIFNPPEHSGGTGMQWVRADMFEITPDVKTGIEEESRKGSKMFIFEGSFFMLIVVSGAFMIYRTLLKSEDLKTRQVNFIHSVTHEFRTPLTSLRLFLETLESGKLEPSQSRQLYAKMLDDCDRLDSMIDNVLEAGRLGREKYELKLSETDLSRDIRQYLDNLTPYLQRQNAIMHSHIEENIRIRSDYHALGRAIRAIVDNAVRYSPPKRREITVSLLRSRRKAVLTIADKGMGIAPVEQKKVFERFYRIGGGRSRSAKGTGLGLYLVRHIVKAHGGEITVESEGTDTGSTFIIQFPLVET